MSVPSSIDVTKIVIEYMTTGTMVGALGIDAYLIIAYLVNTAEFMPNPIHKQQAVDDTFLITFDDGVVK